MTIPAGSRLGPYEVFSPLGSGGMGEVYRARDPRLNREVAIKVLPASFSDDPDRLRRFEQEAKAAGVLNHPNIIAVYDIGSHEGAPYVVSELLEGETLREVLAGGRPADVRSDIFSFGAILYEMLSGRRAFHRDSAADTMSAILKEDPSDLSTAKQDISPVLERIVRHCLEKKPEQRFHSAHDLAF